MKCPHLMTLIFSLCRLEGRFYAPSVLELHEYCRNEEYSRCPLYRKKAARVTREADETRPEITKRED